MQQVLVPSSGHQSAFYDCPNYGPTWGGGHDLYFPGSGLSGYNNPSTYSPGYASLVTLAAATSSTGGCSTGGTSQPPLMSYSSGSLRKSCASSSARSSGLYSACAAGSYNFNTIEMEAYYMY